MASSVSNATVHTGEDAKVVTHAHSFPPPLPWGPVLEVLTEGTGPTRHAVAVVLELGPGRRTEVALDVVAWEVMRAFSRRGYNMQPGWYGRAMRLVLDGCSPEDAADEVLKNPMAA